MQLSNHNLTAIIMLGVVTLQEVMIVKCFTTLKECKMLSVVPTLIILPEIRYAIGTKVQKEFLQKCKYTCIWRS